MHTNEGPSDVRYHVTIQPERHELMVRMRLTGPVARGRIRLEVPTWVPGNYTFSQLARGLFEVHATSTETGAPLAVTRDGWQAFHVEGGEGDVTVTYRVSAYDVELSEPAGIVDNEYAVLLGTRYLHSPAHLGVCTVTYALPPAWEGRVHHPSGATREGPDTWRYPSYEILLDTPVVMGHYSRLERDVRGTPFYFVFVDRGVAFDAKAPGFADQVAAVAVGFHKMFGSFPFSDYTFVLSLNPAAEWGLEHLTSTMCGLGPDVFTDPDLYATGVRVCAHELFHAWNVRRMRPAPLMHLDRHLTSGSFTEGLWMAEGFTRYYEFLSCARTGVYSPDQFFSSVVGYLEHLRAVPAYERVSGADSSLTTYLNHSPKYPGRPASCIDYYDKGMLIAFGIDATLRLHSQDRSLDTAFRGFFEKYVTGGPDYAGYTTRDAIGYFNEIQPGLAGLIESTVNHPGGLTTEALLEHLGFVVHHETVHQLGIMFLDDGAPTLYNVLDDTPAGRSGLAPGDVITGVNGFTYTPAGLAWAASQTAPTTLEVMRGQRRLSFTMTPAPHRKISKLTWNGNEGQAKRLYAWLERRFPLAPGQDFEVDFYENFHGIETVM
jgi:predicted metalloprotease with PDZ domain